MKKFRSNLRKFIEDKLIEQYLNDVTEDNHVLNIMLLSQYTITFSSILKEGQMNVGISQKLLNLYLKYLWCLDKIKIPPNFPVDSIIQKKLKVINAVPWTKMTTKEEYLRVSSSQRFVAQQALFIHS
jgi:hypothetical protein